MWKSVAKTISTVCKNETALLAAENVLQQQLRTTFILKRRFPLPLNQKNGKQRTLRSRSYVYDLVKHVDSERKPDMEVILTSYVEGLGTKGDKVSVRPNYAYNHLLLPGLAVYVNPENIKKFEEHLKNKSEEVYSTPSAVLTVKTLQRMILSVVMNKDNPWTLNEKHIKVSFRKCGYVVPENTITMPEHAISGPNMDWEDKEFFVTVTINNVEKVNVRCKLHHWSTESKDRVPFKKEFWKEKADALLEDQAAVLSTMPHKADIQRRAK